jgi:DNA (cytosine-5)-methyltransferase 1
MTSITDRPRLLDAFCGAGGAARGYQMAGFRVTGVDINPQPRYAGDRFVQADALEVLAGDLTGFDAIHASPPCHDHSSLRSVSGTDGTGWLLAATRELLISSDLPYVLENVEGARGQMREPALFCGGAFALGAPSYGGLWRPLKRHRLFESNIFLMTPGCGCSSIEKLGVYGNGGRYANRGNPDRAGYRGNKQESADALGIAWMTIAEMSQAIPPAYTRHIGEQLADHLAKELTS